MDDPERMKAGNKTVGARLRVVLGPDVAIGPGKADIVAAVETALRKRPEIGYHRGAFRVEVDAANDLILQGEVDSVAAKKIALEAAAAAAPSADCVVDRVRVTPATVMTDADIRSHVRDAFLEERAFADFTIETQTGAGAAPVRDHGDAARGRLAIELLSTSCGCWHARSGGCCISWCSSRSGSPLWTGRWTWGQSSASSPWAPINSSSKNRGWGLV